MRPERSTRGQRNSKFSKDDLKDQEAWKDLSDDDDIVSDEFLSEEEEKEDSDIDDVDEAKIEENLKSEAEHAEKMLNKRKRSKKSLPVHRNLKKKQKGLKKDSSKTEVKKSVTKRYLQKEYLKEAVRTEYDSKRQLMALLMMQEEKKVVLQKDTKENEPMITYKMNKLGTIITFPRDIPSKYIVFEDESDKKRNKSKRKSKKLPK